MNLNISLQRSQQRTISILMAGTACPDLTYREPNLNGMFT